jgi:aspartate/tyrosine/aromatic aminotransferase
MKIKDYLSVAFNAAAEAKKKNKKIIDCVVGSLNDENSNFFVFKTVENIYHNLSLKKIFLYNQKSEGEKFKKYMFD